MVYKSINEYSEEEKEKLRERRRGYAKTYRQKQLQKEEEKNNQEDVKQKAPEMETVKEEFNEIQEDEEGLMCSCGYVLHKNSNGLYPRICPNCREQVDYRGVLELEESPDILVCEVCGSLTKINPGDEIICSVCGQRYEGAY